MFFEKRHCLINLGQQVVADVFAVINIVFAVIGTLFVPDLSSLESRLLLLLGALVYLLLAVKALLYQYSGIVLGTAAFALDSACQLYFFPSAGAVLVRAIIFFYLISGLQYLKREQEKGHHAPV